MGVRNWLRAWITRFLTETTGEYELRGRNDLRRLARTIRKGDVLLVEGDQRVSTVIKFLTHSCWSHAALYIGDELVRRGGPAAEEATQRFGDEAKNLIVEALIEGVVVSPLSKYEVNNIRICRPHALRSDDLKMVLDDAVSAIGWRYDLRNILDLAVHLIWVALLPRRRKRDALRLGSGDAGAVICTSLLGSLYAKVGFPVLPMVEYPEGLESSSHAQALWRMLRRRRPPIGIFRRRHPTLHMPRDFDLSPYFDIVKFNVVSQGAFDYHAIHWADEPDDETDGATAPTGAVVPEVAAEGEPPEPSEPRQIAS